MKCRFLWHSIRVLTIIRSYHIIEGHAWHEESVFNILSGAIEINPGCSIVKYYRECAKVNVL